MLETQNLTPDHHSLNTRLYCMEVSGQFHASAALTPCGGATDIYYTVSWVGIVATKKGSALAHPALVICMPLNNTTYKIYLLPAKCTS